MIIPNKIISINKSILGKIVYILEEIKNGNTNIVEIYYKTKEKFDDINEFIIAVDILYILESVDYNDISKELKYVKRNNM